ncbi:MAG: hypothetical protein H3C35_07750 [Bacteroidetes bacterium]|nr:hypothetical protein [Bacteroidota bacterium]
MNETTLYQPIACSAYDRLEALAVQKTFCTILFREEGKEKEIKGIIADLFSKENAEFLRLQSGEIIRLDAVLSVNGIAVSGACAV